MVILPMPKMAAIANKTATATAAKGLRSPMRPRRSAPNAMLRR